MKCEVNRSCQEPVTLAAIYEQIPSGDALVVFGCFKHLYATLHHYGTPCLVQRVPAADEEVKA